MLVVRPAFAHDHVTVVSRTTSPVVGPRGGPPVIRDAVVTQASHDRDGCETKEDHSERVHLLLFTEEIDRSISPQ